MIRSGRCQALKPNRFAEKDESDESDAKLPAAEAYANGAVGTPRTQSDGVDHHPCRSVRFGSSSIGRSALSAGRSPPKTGASLTHERLLQDLP